MNERVIKYKENQKKIMRINGVYTFLLMASPILFMYGVGIGTITLTDSILMLLNLIFIFKILINGKLSISFNLLPFLIYIVVLSLIMRIDSDALLRTFRYSFYLINIIFFAKKHFDYKLGIKIYRTISILSTGYLFSQIILYNLLGIYLPGVITGAYLLDTDLYQYNIVLQQAQYKRFMSFFEEPSHYAIYILGYITILLFTKMRTQSFSKKDIYELMFLSAGIALSTSILGVMVLGVMLLIWLAVKLFYSKKSFVKVILFVFVFFIVAIFISQTSAFEYFTNISIINRQAGGRFGGYSILKDLNSNVLLTIFGRGMIRNSYSVYLASYPLIIYYFGYLGLFLFIIAFIPYIAGLKMNVSKALLICLFGIALGSEILLGRYILVFLPLIITGHHRTIIKVT